MESYLIGAHGYPSKYLLKLPLQNYFITLVKSKRNFLLGIFLAIFLAPIVLLDQIWGIALGARAKYADPLDKLLGTLLRGRVEYFFNNTVKFFGDTATVD